MSLILLARSKGFEPLTLKFEVHLLGLKSLVFWPACCILVAFYAATIARFQFLKCVLVAFLVLEQVSVAVECHRDRGMPHHCL